MSNSNLYPAHVTRDRYSASVMVDLRKEMTSKLEGLRIEQAQLVETLAKGFDNEVYRKLSVANHRIEVATLRRKGIWLHGSFPEIPQIAKSK